MLRARRGVMLTSGDSTRAAARGLDYRRTRKDQQLHGGLRPRMGATDLWDVACWCGWSSTRLERRDLAVEAANRHYTAVKPGSKEQVANGRRVFRGGSSAKSRTTKSTKKRTPAKRATKQQQKKLGLVEMPKAAKPKKVRPAASASKQPARKKARLEARRTVVFKDTRVTVDHVSADEWDVRCTKCPLFAHVSGRGPAISLAQKHAMQCRRGTRKKSGKRRTPKQR